MIENLKSYIDHTVLKPESTDLDIQQACLDAKKYNFKAVCINPTWVSYVSDLLKGTAVNTCTVIGFPLGANTTATKVNETKQAIKDGADEVDMVINIGAMKSEDFSLVHDDIRAVVTAADKKAIVKVIIETSLLSHNEKIRACEIAKRAGADFVKTSTGFSTGGATVEDIKLMRTAVGPEMGVKASGGVRTYEDAKRMIEAGATRIGTSNGVALLEGVEGSNAY
ncbi:deoxyribose-phosphate aldolase [Marinilactibacillus sp. 15R]|uniref:Deoxyribose-phosphate aldolase n=1 Tax=Marinilactibacillus piezotolerans TaxID=258723 RepID=A0A1I3UUD3_9LACT|nr:MULTISPECIES: deoxyribose-phosphate aldolase [Marinilactibacillus]API89373.1 deoxyribose-phosphate aldolase [Marinilactibacillus sp. 15R]SFJ85451.1 deoxyribose-phosphate aldolase [Marinilactibacillus piezotolerans]